MSGSKKIGFLNSFIYQLTTRTENHALAASNIVTNPPTINPHLSFLCFFEPRNNPVIIAAILSGSKATRIQLVKDTKKTN